MVVVTSIRHSVVSAGLGAYAARDGVNATSTRFASAATTLGRSTGTDVQALEAVRDIFSLRKRLRFSFKEVSKIICEKEKEENRKEK